MGIRSLIFKISNNIYSSFVWELVLKRPFPTSLFFINGKICIDFENSLASHSH